MNNEIFFFTVSWVSGLLSAEIFISTGEWEVGGWTVQMPPLTAENSHFLLSGAQEATLVMVTRLEQLERLHSEITPTDHDYPYKWFTSDPKSKSKIQI